MDKNQNKHRIYPCGICSEEHIGKIDEREIRRKTRKEEMLECDDHAQLTPSEGQRALQLGMVSPPKHQNRNSVLAAAH